MTKAKPLSKAASTAVQPKDPNIAGAVDAMQHDPNVVAFDVKVDKKTGIVRYNAQSSDGRTMTKTIFGAGLEEVVRYDPSQGGTHERNANIRTLLAKGLTQNEVATKMGVSQALVSKVKRSKDVE